MNVGAVKRLIAAIESSAELQHLQTIDAVIHRAVHMTRSEHGGKVGAAWTFGPGMPEKPAIV